MANEIEKDWESMQPILTIDLNDEYEIKDSWEDIVWHELQNAYHSKRVLSATLSGIEETESGSVVLVYYKGHRIIIPVSEMDLNLSDHEGYGEMKNRQIRIINAMIGCEIDFALIALGNEERSVVASRRLAMRAKRRKYYFPNEKGVCKITANRVVQARIIAVAEKVVRLEVFGAECAVTAKNLSWDWVGDARERYHVGDRIRVIIREIVLNNKTFDVKITADIKSLLKNEVLEKLKEVKVQGCYAGRVTDIHKGVTFISLDMGVNAIAHTCKDYRLPGRNDKVSFVVTHIDEVKGVAVGLITRITRQNI